MTTMKSKNAAASVIFASCSAIVDNAWIPKLKFCICNLLLASAISLVPLDVRGELITNPGNDLPLVGGEIQGWTEVIGSNWTRRTGNPDPQAGDAYFFAGAVAFAELSQTIDVSAFGSNIDAGIQRFDFSGYVRSFQQSNPDSSQIILEFEDSAGNVLEFFNSGQIINTTAWQLVADSRFAPVNTRQIEVRLIARRNSGSNNDGYFDSLSLTTTAVPEPNSIVVTAMGGLIMLLLRRRDRQITG